MKNLSYLFISFGGKSGKTLLNFDSPHNSMELFKVSYNKYV